MSRKDDKKRADKKKICSLVKDGFHADHTETYVELICKPKYVCKKCGRPANKARQLCKPVKI